MALSSNTWVYGGCICCFLLGSCASRPPEPEPVKYAAQFVAPPDSTLCTSDLFFDSLVIKRATDGDTALMMYEPNLQAFYRKRGYAYAWFTQHGLNESAMGFKNLLSAYNLSGDSTKGKLPLEAKSLFTKFDNPTVDHSGMNLQRDRLELLLTASFCRFLHVNYPGNEERAGDWFVPSQKRGIDTSMSIFYHPDGALAPIADATAINQRKHLQKALIYYEDLRQNQDWTEMGLGNKAAVVEVKRRLYLLKDLPMPDSSSTHTQELTEAIKSFQARMGNKPTGNMDKVFINSLNKGPEAWCTQIRANLERLKWLPFIPSDEHLLVNIPDFTLHVFADNKEAWSCPVIVGKPDLHTAIFPGMVKSIVFSPYWNVPNSIIAKEIAPSMARGRNYIGGMNMEIKNGSKTVSPGSINWSQYTSSPFPYAIRQRPGGGNALGNVKFLFPNEYDIYIHDTPSRGLFGTAVRAYSHGCVRVGEPFKLAQYLLRNDSTWTDAKIKSAMNRSEETWVSLKNPIPVRITYTTCWADENDKIHFRNDIYGYDERMGKLMFK